MRKGTKIRAIVDVEILVRADGEPWSPRHFASVLAAPIVGFDKTFDDPEVERALRLRRKIVARAGYVLEVVCTRAAAPGGRSRAGLVVVHGPTTAAIYFERGDPRFVEVKA